MIFHPNAHSLRIATEILKSECQRALRERGELAIVAVSADLVNQLLDSLTHSINVLRIIAEEDDAIMVYRAGKPTVVSRSWLAKEFLLSLGYSSDDIQTPNTKEHS